MIELKVGDKFVVRSTPLEATVKNKWNERMNCYLGKTLDVYEVRQSAEGIYYVVENVVFGWHPSSDHIDWEATKKLHEVGKTYEWHEAIKMAVEGTPMWIEGYDCRMELRNGFLAWVVNKYDSKLNYVMFYPGLKNNYIPYVKPIKPIKLITLTDDEKTILRNVNRKYKWVVRNPDEFVSVYADKPIKTNCWYIDDLENGMAELETHNHLFQQIKWEDKEPCLIADLIK